VEDWAEIRRLHRAEGVPIKEIARRLGVARNTVRAALASDRPPKYERVRRGSVADAYEPQVRALLVKWPTMPGPVIAQKIGWPYSEGPLKKLLARIRPEYVGIDPADRTVYEPGQIAQCDLWFPETPVPVTAGQARILPVLVVTLAFSRFHSATMIPSRQAGDILSGMWLLISQLGRVPKTLVWDRESAIGGSGRLTAPAAAFAGTLATRIRPHRAVAAGICLIASEVLVDDRSSADSPDAAAHTVVPPPGARLELLPGRPPLDVGQPPPLQLGTGTPDRMITEPDPTTSHATPSARRVLQRSPSRRSW
jgi:hypothetical protein